MMVATWDDYEEGTEIETGISNCLSDSSFHVSPPSGGQLGWQFDSYTTLYNVTFTTSSTISGFPVYASTDQMNYFLGGVAPTSGCTYSGSNPIHASCTVNLPTYVPLPGGNTYH